MSLLDLLEIAIIAAWGGGLVYQALRAPLDELPPFNERCARLRKLRKP